MSNQRPPTKQFLWKFINLYEFLSFLKNRELYFSRLDTFEDEFECCSEADAWNIVQSLRIAEIIKSHRNIEIEDNFYENNGLSAINHLIPLKEYQTKFCGSCFFSSDSESVAMWKLYSNNLGVAIKFNSKELTQNIKSNFKKLKDTDVKLKYGSMKYVNRFEISIYDENSNIRTLDTTNSPFHKDQSFNHENEYRFIIEKINGLFISEGYGIKLDLDEKYFSFYVSPGTQDWQIDILNSLLNEYGINKKIEKSQIVHKDLLTKYKLMSYYKIIDYLRRK